MEDNKKLGIEFEFIKLVQGKDRSEKEFYAYIRVFSDKLEKFNQLYSSNDLVDLDLSEYGEIIKSGWGNKPSEEVVKYMEDNHNCLESFEQVITESIARTVKRAKTELET